MSFCCYSINYFWTSPSITLNLNGIEITVITLSPSKSTEVDADPRLEKARLLLPDPTTAQWAFARVERAVPSVCGPGRLGVVCC